MRDPLEALLPAARKRLRIWEIQKDWLCSVVGTCLAPADVNRIIRRCQVRYDEGTPAYEIHGFLVMQAGRAERVGREINRVLDARSTGALRKVGAEPDPDRLRALWDDFCGRGLVAAAYWALMSHSHVPYHLKVHAFGEVHMLSHFMGGFNRTSSRDLWLARRELEEAQTKLAKTRRQAEAAAEARDARIVALERELQETRLALTQAFQRRVAARSQGGWNVTAKDRSERRLAAARARARTVEEENARLRGLLDLVTQIHVPRFESETLAQSSQLTAAEGPETTAPGSRCVLYVGGRCQLLPHLRAKAEAHNAWLLHHDGGDKEPLQALGPLVDQADVVICPIDCVSHAACLKAKSLCRRHAKPFIPLRSSSASAFVRAMSALAMADAPVRTREAD